MDAGNGRRGTIERLATGIAHDFNNLLTVVLGNAQLAALELAPGSPGHDRLAHIEAAARRARDRVDRLLAFAGALAAAPDRVDLAALAGATARRRASDGLRCETPCAAVWVVADRAHLRFALDDLIDNALEADGSRRVVIRAGLAAAGSHGTWSLVGSEPRGGAAFVEVEDRGCGLGARALGELCEPYAGGALPGRGLGLAAACGVVRSHRGALAARPLEGGGSVFRLLLPRAQPAASCAPRKAAPLPLSCG